MLVLLALLSPAAAQVVPTECLGAPTLSCPDVDGECTLDPPAGLHCVDLAFGLSALSVEGGEILVYTSVATDLPLRIDELVVEGGDVRFYDPAPHDGAPRFLFRSLEERPSIQVVGGQLTLEGVDLLGTEAELELGVEGGALQVLGGNVFMEGGEVHGGRGQRGAAVWVGAAAAATFDGVAFHDNLFVPLPSDEPGEDFKGRDIYSLGELRVVNSVFTGTVGSTYNNTFGGSIYAGGRVDIGVLDDGSPDLVTTFDGYRAGHGGTVMAGSLVDGLVACGDITVSGTVTDSAAFLEGGAIAASYCESVTIDTLDATTQGADRGGAVWLGNVAVEATIRGSTLTSGPVGSRGGAIYAMDTTLLTVSDTTIVGAPPGRYGPGTDAFIGGGGLYATDTNVVIENTWFGSLDAPAGAVIEMEGGELALTGSVICNSGPTTTAIALDGTTSLVDHTWIEESGSLLATPEATLSQVTIVAPQGSPFDPSGTPWRVERSIVDLNGFSNGGIGTVVDSLFANATVTPLGGTYDSVVFLPNEDDLTACGGRFRLHPDTSIAATNGTTVPDDDWGAFGLAPGSGKLLQLLDDDGDGIDWGADNDGDGWPNAVDCDIFDAAIHPGALEVCDEKDNDCDGLYDLDDADITDAPLWYDDGDGDGYGNGDPSTAVVQMSCEDPGPGWSDNFEDCNDELMGINPGAPEVCGDGLDNDCSPATGDLAEATLWYLDDDGDEHGDEEDVGQLLCPDDDKGSRVTSSDDCDDSVASVYPGAEEIPYDGEDQDCDGSDFDDVDGDGIPVLDDCDDLDAGVGAATPYFPDDDGDGYGALGVQPEPRCPTETDGWSLTGDDCDDARSDVHPGQTEQCGDGLDNDCNPATGDLDDAVQVYVDFDQDGYGEQGSEPEPQCDPSEGWSDIDGDCDDQDASAYPGAVEVPDNGVDEDCSGQDAQRYAVGGCGSCSATEAPRGGWQLLARRR